MSRKLDIENITMGQMERMLGISGKALRMLIDDGRLGGWKIPCTTRNGMQERRSNVWHILAMCEAENYPIRMVELWVRKHFGADSWENIVKEYRSMA